MPTLYLTGVGEDGRSAVVERRPIGLDEEPYQALVLDEAVSTVPSSDSTAALLESMTVPGGTFCNIFAWRPGMFTELHRTLTYDFDVVLSGTVLLELEAETVELHAGDCVLLPGTVHGWRAGPEGGVMAYTLVAGEASRADVGRPQLPHSAITHGH